MNSKQKFSIRKLKIGTVSVLLGAVFLVSANSVLAEDVSTTEVAQTVQAPALTSETSQESETSQTQERLVEVAETTTTLEAEAVQTESTSSEEASQSQETTATSEAAQTSTEVTSESQTSQTEQAVTSATVETTQTASQASAQVSSNALAATENPTTTLAAAQPNDSSSNDLISAPQAWDYGYKGEGTVVAIIDSGIDVDHDTMALTDISKAKYQTEQAMQEAMAAAGITYGKWYNNKVIYAYNYFDSSDDIKEDSTHSHGMHVSSIATGNAQVADPSTNEIVKGVAPEAQVMFMRVFSDRQKTTDQAIYARAILDAVKLGADSINLSLGATSGSTIYSSDVLKNAIQTARDAGVAVAISAGNSGNFGYGASPVSAENPDYATVGDPSTTKDVISVASFNNSTYYSTAITIEGEENQNFPSVATTDAVTFDSNTSYEYTYVGLGTTDDIGSTDLTGKVALIQRGSITFAEKIQNAKAAGAIGVIVFNNTVGILSGGMSVGDDNLDVPSVFITQEAGEVLKSGNYKVSFKEGMNKINNETADQMSDFSSWGLSSDGFLKPDLTAPGGSIYAAGNDNTYNLNSGTSMASPHVAGAIALVKEYLSKEHPELEGEELSSTIKNLLMSTAKAHYDSESKAYTSPRQQGAGLIDVAAAVTTDLYVTGQDNYGSITLGDVEDKFSFEVTVHNIGNEDKTLSYVTQLQTDATSDGKITLSPLGLETQVGQTITVKANSSQTVRITVDASGYASALQAAMPNGYYLEGFVRFLDPTDSLEVISIPYVGFRGDFENLAVVEENVYQLTKEGKNGVYYTGSADQKISVDADVTSLLTESTDDIISQGMKTATVSKVLGSFQNEDGTFQLYQDGSGQAHLAISPNGDSNQDSLTFKGVFLRNYKDMQVAVYAKDDTSHSNPLWTSYIGDGGKDAYEQGSGSTSSIVYNTQWNGQDSNGYLLADGDYEYVVSYYSQVPGADKQSMSFDITIDTQDPVITTATILKNADGSTDFKPNAVYENGSGIYSQEVFYLVKGSNGTYTNIGIDTETGKIVLSDNRVTLAQNEDGSYTIPTGISLDDAYFLVTDFAGNKALQRISTMAELENNYGVVGVFIRNVTDGSVANALIAYKVYDSTGAEVVAPSFYQNQTNFLELPFGSYTIVLQSFDDERGVLVGDKTLKVLINAEESVKYLYFDYQATVKATAVVTFDQDLGQATKVYAVDSDGNATELPGAIYDKNTFEYMLRVGTYTIKVELADGYEVLEDLDFEILENTVNEKTFTLVNKSSLKEEIAALASLENAARYYNADQSSQENYQTAKADAEAVLAAKSSQAVIDAAVKALKAAEEALNGQATDTTLLTSALNEASQIQASLRFKNASSKEQTAYLEALIAAQTLLANTEGLTQAQVDEAKSALQTAYNSLSGKENQTGQLEELVLSGYYALNTKTYRQANQFSKRQFLLALREADLVLNDSESSQDDIDQAYQTLQDAYAALKVSGKNYRPQVYRRY
ncbi:S8 family serine peptidase [Streptococcus loxodontisalivarius]|uniref:Lactocepin n=1 Tax=Streptococcus loxodontisalivarius TaxID=1349415 RepID=A0ABS2PUY4_9STRE|nr:S8 family serine peptidase [Streptococcus loxodontisalivarius]MBM7643701.1 lactocepin [Streptococcus loxodontisalivarius]